MAVLTANGSAVQVEGQTKGNSAAGWRWGFLLELTESLYWNRKTLQEPHRLEEMRKTDRLLPNAEAGIRNIFLTRSGNRILQLSFANATTGRCDPVAAFSNLQINDHRNRVQPRRVPPG
jgi:hypothetical protein